MLRAAAALALALAACPGGAAPPPAGAASRDAAPADTLRGVLEIVGSEPASWVVLRHPGGGADVTLVGEPRLLRALSGAEVMVCGERVPDGFRVDAVTVRAVEGIAVDRVEPGPNGGAVVVFREGMTLALPPLPVPTDRCRRAAGGG